MAVARIFVAIPLALASACSSPVSAPSDVAVELDAFSGLANPTWRLSPAEAVELGRRFRGLRQVTEVTLPEPVLGYRGFRITNPEGGDIPREAYVAGGLVMVEGWGTLYRDTRDVEGWLLERAKLRGYGVRTRAP